MTDAAPDPFIGLTVDDYTIDSLIGRGGMASVYRAADTVLRRPVAIKILPRDALADDDLVRRFEREARLVAQVTHPNVAQIHRTGRIGDCPYYAMELIEGCSLAQVLKTQGPLDPRRCVDYMIQAAKGLRAAAAHGIIHRDIKPANMMITPDGILKIVDFGIAKAFRDETYQTMAGRIMGTPRYMSPEQGRGDAVDQRSDIYSLGASFYHLLAGVPPFDADNAITLIYKHSREPVRSIRQFNMGAPDRLCNILYAMLQKLPEKRYADYDQLIVALDTAEQSAAAPKEEEEPAPGPARKPYRWMAAVLAVLTLGLIFAAALSGPKPEKTVPAPRQAKPADKEILNVDKTVDSLRKLNEFQKEMRQEQKK